MSDEPSYLRLLNALAVAEQRGHAVLAAWRDATPDVTLEPVLDVVATRKSEHAAAFTERLSELGYRLRPATSQQFDRDLVLAGSRADDAGKFREIVGYGADDGAWGDPLGNLFDDPTIDPATGALLGRFIAEERDSARRLRTAFNTLER